MTDPAIQQALKLAQQHQLAGQFPQAEEICVDILSAAPNQVNALLLLGTLAMQQGRRESAAGFIGRAVALQPNSGAMHAQFGDVMVSMGRLAEATEAYSRAISAGFRHPVMFSNQGNCLKQLGRLNEAVFAHKQAISLKPDFAEAYVNLASALQNSGLLTDAIDACRKAILLKPDLAEAHYNLGVALEKNGDIDQSILAYQQAVTFKPDAAEFHSNLGNMLREKKRFDESIAAQQRAIALNPGFFKAYLGLGNAFRGKGDPDAAIAAYQQAIALNPNYGHAYCNLGAVYVELDQLDAAIAAHQKAIELLPHRGESHAVLSHSLLLLGRFEQGWEEYEWRGIAEDLPPRRSFHEPKWEGSPLEGKTILIHAEQGLGDTLQFVRYLPMVLQMGGKVIFECQPELIRLLGSITHGCQVIELNKALPPFDVQSFLLGLPRIFRTRLDSIPRQVPYLAADPDDIKVWQKRLEGNVTRLKVGLVWAGNPSHSDDRNRSIAVSRFAPLANVPNVDFISLQKGSAAPQAIDPDLGFSLLDLTPNLKDMADTAALISNLDLVIGVDTAMVHLAGALGKPVWVLLPFSPDWRWMLDRNDSPWYPTMRLFRQPVRKDWDSVIQQIAQALQDFQR